MGTASARDDGAERSTLDGAMPEPPGGDPIAKERARARVERALFGDAAPARLGRYEIRDPVAGGGMGLVYAAHDPELDRRVALKVLHPGRDHEAHAHARLMQEARALARLDHPHVVKIHDVLDADGQIVVVMALLEGVTLATWEQAARRDWRAVIAAYAQAGDGLAAAHSLDIIHRDFKPANAIIGPDGHVRVLDFGLARLAAGAVDAATGASAGSVHETWTVAGAFLGTLAYASPEQLAGEPVTAASDQFSFCVALHRALEGTAPFAGESLEELAASIHRGDVRAATDTRRLPAWLRRIVRRGLAADPARRFPSMRALLAELRRARGWQRWRWPLASGALAAIAVAAVILGRPDAAATCDGGAAEVATVWGPAARADVAGRFATLAEPWARALAPRVTSALDADTQAWSAAHRDACLAHRRGVESDRLLDRKMRCLDRQLGDLGAAASVLARTDDAHAGTVLDVVAGIPAVRACTDPARVLGDTEPPATPAKDAEVGRVRAQISGAAALDHAGRSDEALALATTAKAAAAAAGYAPAIAEADLALGKIFIGRADPVAATPVLQEAREIALATGSQARLAVEAGARLVYTEGAQQADLGRMGRDLAYLVPMSASLVEDHFVRPLLFSNAAEIAMIADHPEEARAYLALAQAAEGDDPDIELVAIDRSLAMLARDPAERSERARAAWARTRDVLGPHHLRSLAAQLEYAVYQTDPARALELLAPVCDEYRASHETLVDTILDCELVHAFVADEAGAHDDAQRAYAAIMAATPPALVDHAIEHQLAAAELALASGQLATARAGFAAVMAARGSSANWWERQAAYQADLGLARIALAEKRGSDATALLTTAAAGYADLARINPGIMYVRRAAIAQRLLATMTPRAETPEHPGAAHH